MDSKGLQWITMHKIMASMDSVEFLEFLELVTLKKGAQRLQGPRETGYWEPNRKKKQAEQPNHRARRNGVLGAQ